jgi:hypothetical protein
MAVSLAATDASPSSLLRYWAHCTLHRLHWTITFNDAEAIDMALRLGNLYLR